MSVVALSAADAADAGAPSAGVPCWIAPRDVHAGESYAAAIEQAINSCRALVLHKLGRTSEARAHLDTLQKIFGDTASYQLAQIHAVWGEPALALDALETGYRVQDPGLSNLKVDELMDPLRKQPRFIALMQKINFPD